MNIVRVVWMRGNQHGNAVRLGAAAGRGSGARMRFVFSRRSAAALPPSASTHPIVPGFDGDVESCNISPVHQQRVVADIETDEGFQLSAASSATQHQQITATAKLSSSRKRVGMSRFCYSPATTPSSLRSGSGGGCCPDSISTCSSSTRGGKSASRGGVVSSSKRKVVVMTMSVIIGFLVCETPYFVICLVRIYSDYRITLTRLLSLAEIMAMAHSALNPILYFIFSKGTTNRACQRLCLACSSQQRRRHRGHGTMNGCRGSSKYRNVGGVHPDLVSTTSAAACCRCSERIGGRACNRWGFQDQSNSTDEYEATKVACMSTARGEGGVTNDGASACMSNSIERATRARSLAVARREETGGEKGGISTVNQKSIMRDVGSGACSTDRSLKRSVIYM
jgi:hypothetical protein